MTVPVVTARGAAARDAATIAAGIPARALLSAAGAAAADVMASRLGDALARGVGILTGPGNNGGDGWVVARLLAARGVRVRVHEVAPARTGDARAAREDARPHVSLGAMDGTEGVVVDALLGTGARGAPMGAMGDAVRSINARRAAGATVVALDLPTGVDADEGGGELVAAADLTISFGTVKRGHLLARSACGRIVVVDIGLGAHASLADGAPTLADARWVREVVPAIGVDVHKGLRRRVVLVGGARGMAGAVILAARAASRSGIGMVRVLVEEPSLAPVQSSVAAATAATWPIDGTGLAGVLTGYAHAVLIGPGLGQSSKARVLLDAVLETWRGPTVLDADAITHFAGDIPGLAAVLAGRPALLTPHASELARLIGAEVADVNRHRFEIARDVANALGASVLLKGVPTVITAPDGASMVTATGTPVLATAGSGDLLGGIAVTLLAQIGDPLRSGTCAAWIHGRAAEIAGTGRPWRGVTLDDVLDGLAHAWRLDSSAPPAPILAELPAVDEGHVPLFP